MIFLVDLSLPFANPVLIFSVVLFIFLTVPIILNKLKIPSIIGLILTGVAVGPNGFNILERSSSIVLFGTVGLLYIMFLASLELDLNEFKKNKNRSIVFGILTFIIPFSIGTLICYYLLEYSLATSFLISSMFSSHTMVSYPIASKLGITKNQAVTIAVGGTIITDTTVLIVLAVITSATEGNLTVFFWGKLVLSLLAFTAFIFYGYPRIGSWFFKNIQGDNTSQYIFVLAMVFIAAFLAEFAGVEPIIGAFMAGLALNKLIPHTSALMNRIEFVGNALFIPFFLISVGMLVNVNVLFEGSRALIVAGTLIFVALITKYLAAYISGKVYKYSSAQINLLFGLSSSHAAATLAVILVGFQLELVNENVLNGTILLILVTCLVGSFVTESAGRKLAIIETGKKPALADYQERILVPISNPATIERLTDLAIMIKDQASTTPIYPLAIVYDNEEAKERILTSNRMLERAVKQASGMDIQVQITTRVDLNVSNGILRAIKELLVTVVIIGWNPKLSTRDRIFGSLVDSLLQKSGQMTFVANINTPLNTINKISVVVPEYAEVERGFTLWLTKLKVLSKQTGADLVFYCANATMAALRSNHDTLKPSTKASFVVFEDWDKFSSINKDIEHDDLLTIISAREGTPSHNSNLEKVPDLLSKDFEDKNFIILYPEQ